MPNKWKRKCPECGKEITYSTKYVKIRAKNGNKNCLSCAMTGISRSEETRKKIGESNKGQKRSEEVKKNMSESHKGIKRKPFTDEQKKKISKSVSGEKNGMYGKFGENNPNFGKIRSKEIRKKLSEFRKGKPGPNLGKIFDDTWRKNMRLSAKKRIEKNKFNGGQMTPGYNSIGCEMIRWFNMYYNFNFQHAENGGEKCIDGYFPDGLDEKRKTIIEIDEQHHFNSDGKLKLKDTKRQEYLENLGYKFIRVRI